MKNSLRLLFLTLLAALCCFVLPMMVGMGTARIRGTLEYGEKIWVNLTVVIALLLIFGAFLGLYGFLARSVHTRAIAATISVLIAAGSIYLAWFVPFGGRSFGTEVLLGASVFLGCSLVSLFSPARSMKTVNQGEIHRLA